MKLSRILSLMLICALCAGLTPAVSEGANGIVCSTSIIHELDVSADEWLLSPELRAMFAIIMQFEIYSAAEYDLSAISDYNSPTIYVCQPAGMEGSAVGVASFYPEDGIMLTATYTPGETTYTASMSAISGDPAAMTEALMADGVYSACHEVSDADNRNIAAMINAAMTGEIAPVAEAPAGSITSTTGAVVEEVVDDVEDAGAESDAVLYDPLLIHTMDNGVDEWLSTPENRALFAVLLEFELYCIEEFGMEYYVENYDLPAMYVTIPTGFDADVLSIMIFYPDAGVVFSGSYVPELGQISGFVTDLEMDPGLAMDALVEEGVFTEYYEITVSEQVNALETIDGMLE